MSSENDQTLIQTLGELDGRRVEVALFLPDLRGGGAQRVTVNLARGLTERGIAVDIVLGTAHGSFLGQVPPEVRVADLQAKRMLKGIRPLSRYLKTVQPEVLLSALDHVNIGALLARKLSRCPVRTVIAVHSVTTHRAAADRSLRSRLYHGLVCRCYRWADAVVAVSRGVADMTAELTGMPRDRIEVIYNPVLSSELTDKAAKPVEHPWFAPGQPKVVLAVGNLSPWKDYPTLLRAFAILRRSEDVRLMILGEGEQRGRLESMVTELRLTDSVSLPGFVDNPYAYMAKAGALVLCSQWEALPTVLIEGLALKVPVVSTDCRYGPGEILAGGKYGRLVPVGDAEALANGLREALAQGPPVVPPEALAPYTFETAIDRYVQILLGQTGRPSGSPAPRDAVQPLGG